MLVRTLFGKRYTDLCYGYTAFWKRCLPVLQLRSDGFEIETEMNVRAAVANLKVVEVASFEHPRIAGEAHLRPAARRVACPEGDRPAAARAAREQPPRYGRLRRVPASRTEGGRLRGDDSRAAGASRA